MNNEVENMKRMYKYSVFLGTFILRIYEIYLNKDLFIPFFISNFMDPSQSIRGIKSDLLKNKKIVYGITGSVSAEESVKITRELIRHGAEVFPVMTDDATSLITDVSIEYATGKKPIIKVSGLTEHVLLEKDSDLLLIAPCSANTIGKIACGIADTSVSLFALTFLGSKKILIAPAMSMSMYNNPIVKENIQKLEKHGVKFINPKFEEGKAKLPSVETIVAYAIREIQGIKNKRVAIIGGKSEEDIDDVRVITNKSSGKTSIELAKVAFYLGFDVTLYMGISEESIPEYINTKHYRKVEDLINKVEEFLNYDIVIVPAALSDFSVDKIEGKIQSNSEITLKLKPLPKFLKIVSEKYDGILIGFKAEVGYNNVINEAKEMIDKYKLRFVVGNDIREVERDKTKVLIIEKDKIDELSGDKFNVALEIFRRYILKIL